MFGRFGSEFCPKPSEDSTEDKQHVRARCHDLAQIVKVMAVALQREGEGMVLARKILKHI